jgi:hypothetical protein
MASMDIMKEYDKLIIIDTRNWIKELNQWE